MKKSPLLIAALLVAACGAEDIDHRAPGVRQRATNNAILPLDFEPSTWPSTGSAFSTQPQVWSHQVHGHDVVFTNWALYKNATRIAYLGEQGTRAKPLPGTDARIKICGVQDPTGLSFKLASTGVVKTKTQQWTLRVRMQPSSGAPCDGSPLTTAPEPQAWTNFLDRRHLAGSYQLSREAMRFSATPGSYDIELSATRNGSSTSSLLLDELQIWRAPLSGPAPSPMPIGSVTKMLNMTPLPTKNKASMLTAELAQRNWLLHELDKHVLDYVTTYFHEPAASDDPEFTWANANPPFVSFFRNRLLKVIKELESGIHPASDELLIWKLYSSAYVIRTPSKTFAIDLTSGPNNKARLSAESRNIAMALNEAETMRLAKQIDFAFFTHYHHDHVNFAMIAALQDAGATVYGPMPRWANGTASGDAWPSCELQSTSLGLSSFPTDLNSYYQRGSAPLPYTEAADCIVDPWPGSNTQRTLLSHHQDFSAVIFAGAQGMTRVVVPGDPVPANAVVCPVPAGPGCVDATPIVSGSDDACDGPQASDPTNYSYIIRTDNGIDVAFFGDSRWWNNSTSNAMSARDPVNCWMSSAADQGARIDLKLAAGPLIRGAVWRPLLHSTFAPLVRMHGHEWELNHDPPGIYGSSTMWTDSGPLEQAMPIGVGERFRYAKFSVKPSARTDANGITHITFDTLLPVSARVHFGPSREKMVKVAKSTSGSALVHRHSFAIKNLSRGKYFFYVDTPSGKASHGKSKPWMFTVP